MLAHKEVKLNYRPFSWGIKMVDGRITASVLWKAEDNDWTQFFDDEAEYREFCDTFIESKEFTELGRAYRWLEETVEEKNKHGRF